MIQGAAAHHGVEIEITEEACVLRGDPACVITVEGQQADQTAGKALLSRSRSIRPSATTRPPTRTTGTRQS